VFGPPDALSRPTVSPRRPRPRAPAAAPRATPCLARPRGNP